MTNKASAVVELLAGIIAAVLGLLLVLFSFGNGLKFASYDLLFAPHPIIQPAEAIVVYMDEDSHTALDQSFTEAWDRNLHARLVDRLTDAGARLIVFDIHFSGPGPNPEATTNLARAIKRHGNVILGADVAGGTVGQLGIKRVLPPYEALGDAAAAIGSVEVDAAHDVAVRRHLRGHPDDLVPSLSWAAAGASGNPWDTERWVNYYGPPGTIPHLNYDRALEAPPEIFKDKAVFIGARLLTKLAAQRKDEYRSPYSLWMKESLFISGVEIQATQYLNLIRQDWLRRAKPATEACVVIVLGLLAGFGLMQLRPWVAVAVALVTAVTIIVASYLLFANARLWFPWLIPVVAQLPVALTLAVSYNSFRIYLENKLLEQSLARHLSPVRAKQLVRQRELLQPGAEKQVLSIMFTDIADFTKLSEGMDSDDLAKLMNSYFEEAISCVYETDGFLVKLIGDALFAIWNAPLPQPDHHERVFRAALLLKERVTEFKTSGGLVLRTRIGIHSGVADVGNFGSSKRFDYTAIGESVNLASRLEGLNKHLGTQILASGEAQSAVATKFDFRYLGRFRLKGFEKGIEAHELLAAPAEWQKAFAEGLDHFRGRNLDAAETAFARVLKANPNDGPSRFYLAQLRELRANPPDAKWGGEIELKEK